MFGSKSASQKQTDFAHTLPRKAPDPAKLGLIEDLETAEMPDPAMRTLYDWWKGHATGSGLPHRRDFHPTDIPLRALPWMAIMNVEHNPLRFQNRLVGTALTEAAGLEATGLYVPAPDGNSNAYKRHLKRLYWLVMKKQPYLVCDQPATWAVKDYRHYDALVLPLANGGADDEVGLIMFLYHFLKAEDG